jgi:predicted GNAT family acetyltransferase
MAENDVVVHEAENSRYVLKRGDQVLGATFYETGPRGEIVFTHTEVDPELGERGLGSQLIRGALDDVRTSTDAKVVATCPFVRRFLRTHPDYQDLTRR